MNIKILLSSLPILIFVMLMGCANSAEKTDGDAFFENGDYAEAISAYTKSLASSPDDTKLLYNRGRAYEEIGKNKLAIADFEEVIRFDPKNNTAYVSLAKLSYNEKNYNQVLVYAKDAIELNENYAVSHFLHARAAHQLGYFQQALESYNNAIHVDKEYGEAYLYRGALKLGMEKRTSACEDLKLAKLLNANGAEKAVDKHCQ